MEEEEVEAILVWSKPQIRKEGGRERETKGDKETKDWAEKREKIKVSRVERGSR